MKKNSERRNFSLSEIKSVDKKIDAKAEINFQKPFGNENKKKSKKSKSWIFTLL